MPVMRRIPAYIAAIAFLASACTRAVTAEHDGSPAPDFHASIEQDTKTFLDDDLVQHWIYGDQICVYAGNTAGVQYSFTGSTGDTYGTFKSSQTAGGQGEALDANYAVSPYSAAVSASTDGSLGIIFPDHQQHSTSEAAAGLCLMAAKSQDNNLSFKNLCGLLNIRLYGSGASVSSLSVKGNNNEIIAGSATINFEDGIPAISMNSSGGSKEIILSCSEPLSLGATESEATEFWLALPPMEFSKGITVIAIDNNGRTFEAATAKTLTISRSRVCRMAPLAVEMSKPTGVSLGSPLPAWKQGYLDIHGINGGRGEAFYYIFPDGTTMLVDAAGAPQNEYGYDSGIASRPSVSVSCGQVIVNYIRHFAPVISSGHIDYFMTSHYHGDHIGAWRDNYTKFRWQPVNRYGTPVSSVNLAAGGFLLNGLSDVGMSIPIRTVIDRGDWADRPSVEYIDEGAQKRYANYINFLDWSARNYGTERKTLAIGHTDQIVPLHDAASYPSFSVRGIAAGGDIWTGSGTGVNTNYVPSAADCLANINEWEINENIFSCVFHMSYGKFDWFAGGDIQFSGKSTHSWKDIELPISKVMKKVEAMKASHHSTKNTNSTELLGVLKPDVYIAGVWQDVQPNPATIKRVLTASPSVKMFTTNIAESNLATLSSEGIDTSKFLSTQGHVVIRVLPGGASYYVYVLDDSDLEYKVKAVFGPYLCK